MYSRGGIDAVEGARRHAVLAATVSSSDKHVLPQPRSFKARSTITLRPTTTASLSALWTTERPSKPSRPGAKPTPICS